MKESIIVKVVGESEWVAGQTKLWIYTRTKSKNEAAIFSNDGDAYMAMSNLIRFNEDLKDARFSFDRLNYHPATLYKSNVNGSYYEKRESAELAGCCKCGDLLIGDGKIRCQKCEIEYRRKIDESKKQRYLKMPIAEGVSGYNVFYDRATGDYHFDIEDIIGDYESSDADINESMIVACVPECLHQLDTDIWEGDIHENFEFPKELTDKLHELNEIASNTVGGYVEGSFRVDIKEYLRGED